MTDLLGFFLRAGETRRIVRCERHRDGELLRWMHETDLDYRCGVADCAARGRIKAGDWVPLRGRA